ncbi:MAG: class I SAM-dependent methyltransferase [Gammaproteobacteria bacterium]
MDTATRDKWDRAARTFDLMSAYGPEWRWKPAKQRVFECMKPDAKILFLALGTGLDIACFPPGRDITAIDISPKMVAAAEKRVDAYPGHMTAQVMDVHEMDFPEDTFDQVFTSCTFCSVPNPVEGLGALRRVLKPGGELHMFEHTGSRVFPFSVMMKYMSPLATRFGPELDRDTVSNVRAAGFEITGVNHVFLDTVKTIHAVRPSGPA